MASANETPAARPSGDNARFAAYLANLGAPAEDPDAGEHCRAVPAEDPETQCAWFEVIEDLFHSPVPPYASGVWAAAVLALATCVIALVLHAVGFHP